MANNPEYDEDKVLRLEDIKPLFEDKPKSKFDNRAGANEKLNNDFQRCFQR